MVLRRFFGPEAGKWQRNQGEHDHHEHREGEQQHELAPCPTAQELVPAIPELRLDATLDRHCPDSSSKKDEKLPPEPGLSRPPRRAVTVFAARILPRGGTKLRASDSDAAGSRQRSRRVTPILSRVEMRELDRVTIEEGHVPSLVLMENAGRGAAELVEREFSGTKRVVVVAGAGNNGGDGFVVARRLLASGFDVRVVLVADAARLRGDALENYNAYIGVGGAVATASATALAPLDEALRDADVIVDAIFGTGLDRRNRRVRNAR